MRNEAQRIRKSKTMAFASTASTVNAGLFDRAAAAVTALRTRVENYRVYRTTFNELNALSNRDLTDLALSRSMLKSISLEAAYGK